jgi:stalled ribosome alternative rescue factor ArfA
MKDQRVMGKRKTNPIAKQLSDPLWKQRIVKDKKLYDRKIKHKDISNVVYRQNRPRG